MRRFRILFVVLLVLLTGPLLILVQRATRSVTLERTLRHQVVAERVFDEMERALSEFLEPEEQRPFDRYTTTAGAPEGDRAIVGRFQVEPDGTIHFRSAGRGDNDAQAMVERYWRTGRPEQAAEGPPVAQRPGSTLTLGAVAPQAPAAAPEAQGERAVTEYLALKSLNKAASERLERQFEAKVLDKEESTAWYRRLQEQSAAAGVEKKDELLARDSRAVENRASTRNAPDLPPMSGQLLDARRLLLYRTLVHGKQGYRQGLVVDVEALCARLRANVLSASEIGPDAAFECSTTPGRWPQTPRDAPYAYQHRFADPFEAMTARLVLQPLPGAGTGADVYTLSALLLGTAALGMTALYRMVSVVVRYSEQRANFVAAVSHELKTPLTAIRMYGEMLRDDLVPSEEKRREYYGHITRESERLTRLIGNVLEFSRLERGTRPMALATACPAEVVREVADLLRPQLQAEGFALVTVVDEDVPPVPCERDALLQVLSNLVDNAVKYARASSDPSIELRCSGSKQRVTISVRDHGPGVPPRDLARIFEPFYRGENELTRRHKGTGIGLALVKGLAQRMGAQVAAHNCEDGGLEVEIHWRTEAGRTSLPPGRAT